MNLFKFVAPVVLLLVAHVASAETPQELAIRKQLAPTIGPGVVIESVKKTGYGGLYEVRVGSDVLYTDEQAKFLFVGHILDSKTSKDFTKARIDEITRIKFSDLPFESAIKTVRGDGKRVIAVFEDPNCGYCKRFRHTLQGVDNVTVYTFLYNILAPSSAVESKNVWCTADRAKAWDNWMLNGIAAATAPAACTTPNDKIFALGQKLRVTGTPTIFFTDGTRVPGALDDKALENKFAAVKNGVTSVQ